VSTCTTATIRPVSPPHEAAPRRTPPEWLDRFLGSDPGLTRLFTALQAIATIGVAMLAEWLFVGWTHALQIDTHGVELPAAQAAAVAAQHHGVLVIAILLGSIIGMIASFSAAMFTTPRAQLESFALMPVPMIAGLALGLALAPYRVLALASFVAVLAGGAYCRRFGPRGFVGGMVLFMGDFFGFFLNGELHLSDLGWLSAEIAIGVLVAILAQFTLFYPSRRAALRRMRHSYGVRAREVATAGLDLFEDHGDRQRAWRRLHRRLIRLNEAALLIDAQLGHPGALPAGWSATVLHQLLFDGELALTNLARFSASLADARLSDEQAGLIRQALAAVAESDSLRAEFAAHELLARLPHQESDDALDDGMDRVTRVITHRFAISVLGFTEAVQGWVAERARILAARAAKDAYQFGEGDLFAPSVLLFGGWLPGSAMVSAAASLEIGRPALDPSRLRRWFRHSDRVRLAPYSRVAIQMSVAVTAAIVFGDVVSGRRFYWAVLAAFITFMGANNAGEQLRKGFFRVTGTVVGVLLGAVVAHLVGDRTPLAIAVILIALFFGLYLMRISYAFMVIGITIMVSQLYVQLDEFSNSLLVLRLEETALGAAVAAVTVLCVLPLRTGRVARVAARQYLEALSDVVEPATRRLGLSDGEPELRSALRRLDGAYQTLLATMIPLRIPLTGRAEGIRERFLQTAAATRHYARNLLTDTASGAELALPAREQLDLAAHQLTSSLGQLIGHLDDNEATPRIYVRAAALFDLTAPHLSDSDYLAPSQLALRDFQLLDGAMANLAHSIGLSVRALDTASTADTARDT
jgi:uncharacterized membrane protein YccC